MTIARVATRAISRVARAGTRAAAHSAYLRLGFGDSPQDASRVGTLYYCTALHPVEAGRETALQQAIDRLGLVGEEPFGRLGLVHFAHLVLVPQLIPQQKVPVSVWRRLFYDSWPYRPDRLRSTYLHFSCVFDGERDAFLEALRAEMPDEIMAIWGACVEFPGTGSFRAFRDYFARCQIPHTFTLGVYGTSSLPEVLESLDLCNRLRRFGAETQDMDAAALQASFVEHFCGGSVSRRSGHQRRGR